MPADSSGELLPNGIRLPAVWPPHDRDLQSAISAPAPWLAQPPAVIPIDVGRQLFVDDYLIESTTLVRECHQPVKHNGNPVFSPETDLEKNGGLPIACPKSGGVWWDPQDQIFKMWYEAGWLGANAYATSTDGIHWQRPLLDIAPGTNRLLPDLQPDSSTVVLDHEAADHTQRFKMFLRPPDGPEGTIVTGFVMTSPDGIHWSDPAPSGISGDRSTIFYNPFREKWVFSLRFLEEGRIRRYHEHTDFLQGALWEKGEPVFWACADELDPVNPATGQTPQLYNLDAVAYESLILGVFQIHRGPTNEVCMTTGTPKITDLTFAYSRDGFHWHRPDRRPCIAGTGRPGSWERGYIQSVGGVCTIVGDELWFYYIGFCGDPTKLDLDWKKNGMYANGSTGLARLRRDGFASMNTTGDAPGTLTTRLLTFNGRHLFVNVDCPAGELRAEILDETGSVLAPFKATICTPVRANSTRTRISWDGVTDLAALQGRHVRFRFHLVHAKLYAFWVSPDAAGTSNGYVAAGGPGFTGATDKS